MVGCTASSSCKAEKKAGSLPVTIDYHVIPFFAAQGSFDLCSILHTYKRTSDKENQYIFK